jgi:hypothetical protein
MAFFAYKSIWWLILKVWVSITEDITSLPVPLYSLSPTSTFKSSEVNLIFQFSPRSSAWSIMMSFYVSYYLAFWLLWLHSILIIPPHGLSLEVTAMIYEMLCGHFLYLCHYVLTWGKTVCHEGVWGNGCTDPRFLDLGTCWRWVVSFKLRPLYTRYPLNRRLSRPQNQYEQHREDNIFASTGTRTLTLWSSSP